MISGTLELATAKQPWLRCRSKLSMPSPER
jgi:hypothetical protein